MEPVLEEGSTDEKQSKYLRREFDDEESTVNSLEDEPLMIHSSSSLVTDGKSLILLTADFTIVL